MVNNYHQLQQQMWCKSCIIPQVSKNYAWHCCKTTFGFTRVEGGDIHIIHNTIRWYVGQDCLDMVASSLDISVSLNFFFIYSNFFLKIFFFGAPHKLTMQYNIYTCMVNLKTSNYKLHYLCYNIESNFLDVICCEVIYQLQWTPRCG